MELNSRMVKTALKMVGIKPEDITETILPQAEKQLVDFLSKIELRDYERPGLILLPTANGEAVIMKVAVAKNYSFRAVDKPNSLRELIKIILPNFV